MCPRTDWWVSHFYSGRGCVLLEFVALSWMEDMLRNGTSTIWDCTGLILWPYQAASTMGKFTSC